MRCEYARHKAWKAKQILEQMVAGVSIDEDPIEFKRAIEQPMNELCRANEELEQDPGVE